MSDERTVDPLVNLNSNKCDKCGIGLPPSATTCVYCGHKLGEVAADRRPRGVPGFLKKSVEAK